MVLETPGRGAGFNPPNRFDSQNLDPIAIDVPCEDDEPRTLKTSYFRDRSKTVLAKNDSPDIGFTYSINPYRGCEHGCIYCLHPDTPILYADMTWKPIGGVQVGDALMGFDEFPPPGGTRKFRQSIVERVWWSRRPTMRLVTDHAEVVTTAEHRWLLGQDFGWLRTDELRSGDQLQSVLQRDARTAGLLACSEELSECIVRVEPPDLFARRAKQARRPAVRAGTSFPMRRLRLFGSEMNLDDDTVRAIEEGEVSDVVDIQTSTGTFFAGGLATHNCYARPSHEWLGFSAGLDFESKIVVKEDAPELLRAEMSRKGWVPQVVCMSGNTDCYQPAERVLKITRRCLEVFLELGNPVGVITKNAMVARDVDVLRELAARRLVHVTLSITTLDPGLARKMEPRASTPAKRLEAIRVLADAGVSVGVNVAPIIPGLTDEEVPAILKAAREAGATSAGRTIVRLPYAVKPLFLEWLEREFPLRAPKVIARLRDIRGDGLTDSRFGTRREGEGEIAAMIGALFDKTCARLGLSGSMSWELDTTAFCPPGGKQGELFGLAGPASDS